MGRLVLVTGGSRSGKSAFAQRLAESQPKPRYFIATCPVTDEEMAMRIRRHQQLRYRGDWQTIEEELDLAGVLQQLPSEGVILIDCLSLWINNLLHWSCRRSENLGEPEISHRVAALVEVVERRQGSMFMVTGEVGSGIVPENALVRKYRDLLGWCNQCVAREADEVYLVACGLSLQLKGRS